MDIFNVAVVGAGTMGSGIAQVCAAAGIDIVMLDLSDEALQRGFSVISDSLDRSIKRQKLTADAKQEILGRINVTTRYSDIAGVDLVIEAASENEGLKLRLLKEIENTVSATTIIATNTSSISITKLAASTRLPERVIGTHFFNPVPVMALVELIRGLQTSDETQKRVEAFVKDIGKTAIVAKNSPGFAVNRILCPMINEAVFVLQEGLATPEDIDDGMKLGANHPIGPLALADLIGLDTMLAVLDVFYHGFNDPKYRPAPLLREMVDAGYLGRKSGRGFYRYDRG